MKLVNLILATCATFLVMSCGNLEDSGTMNGSSVSENISEQLVKSQYGDIKDEDITIVEFDDGESHWIIENRDKDGNLDGTTTVIITPGGKDGYLDQKVITTGKDEDDDSGDDDDSDDDETGSAPTNGGGGSSSSQNS